tara:strand:- start:1225 stop:2160 length:936 start_codon:yes stop_codon:yes gene_type:complete
MTSISGSISYAYIKLNKDIELYIYFDDHGNTNYCKDDSSVFLDTHIKKITKNKSANIYLEEPLNMINVRSIWKNKHVNRMSSLYKTLVNKDVKILNFDIRSEITMFDIKHKNSLYGQIKKHKCHNLLYNINYMLEPFMRDLFDFDIKIKRNKTLKKIKKTIYRLLNKHKKNEFLVKHFKYIMFRYKKLYKFLYKKDITIKKFVKVYDYASSDHIGYPYKMPKLNDKNVLDYYEFLLDSIMEFYFMLLLIDDEKRMNILYTGAYHSSNILYILKKYYGSKVVKSLIKNMSVFMSNSSFETITSNFKNNCIKI